MSQSLIKFELNSLKSQEITLRQAQRPRFDKLNGRTSTGSATEGSRFRRFRISPGVYPELCRTESKHVTCKVMKKKGGLPLKNPLNLLET